jgi:16S rRNA pseudouridine516 synthase
MKLLKLLANLGYGSRREVSALFDRGAVCDALGATLGEKSDCDPASIRILGAAIDPLPGSVLMLNKPIGYTCSTRDPNLVVYDLLPPRFRLRAPIMAPIGRLDRQTSGLLLFTDDGQLLHKITSPKTHLVKRYRVSLNQALRGEEAAIFASGTLMLEGETTPLRPARLELLSAQSNAATEVRVTITEGRYHQIRRMFAALGNHVEVLHREQIGGLSLENSQLGALHSGAWGILTPVDIAKLWIS